MAKTRKEILRRKKVKVYYKRCKTKNKWCVGAGKGFPSIQQFSTWIEAINYALWYYCNKFVMPLG